MRKKQEVALSDIIFKIKTEIPSSPVEIEDLEAMAEESSLMLRDAVGTRELGSKLVGTGWEAGRAPDERGFKGSLTQNDGNYSSFNEGMGLLKQFLNILAVSHKT